MNTNPQCHDHNFRPDIFLNSGVVHLERVPKNSRISLAENMIPKIIDICETSSIIALWCLLLSSLRWFLENHLEEVNFRGHHSVQLSTSVFGKVPLRKNRNET